jgi:hypothetical protein
VKTTVTSGKRLVIRVEGNAASFSTRWSWPTQGKKFARLLLMQLLLVFLLPLATRHSSLLYGQSGAASVSGRVTDQTNAVVPDVEVEIKNVDTGVSQLTKTNNEGFYSFPSLLPGNYLMNVRKAAFRTVSLTGITLHVQDEVSRNFTLQVGSSAESVTVRADSLNVNTTDGSVSTVIDHTFIENMPLNGNNLATLFELVPGVVTNAAAGAVGEGGGISVNGQRPTGNYLTVDGAAGNLYMSPNNGPNVMGAGIATSASGGTNGLLPVDAIEEFRMQTSSYDAQYGRTPGGQIEVKTRGGTNAFHGSLFENFRNQVMDATDYFIRYDNLHYGDSLTQPPLRYNDFGGTFAGPILKGRLFFFVAHESLLLNQPQPPTVYDVPSQQTRTSSASAFQPYMSAFPSGNSTNQACPPDDLSCDLKNPGSDLYSFVTSNTIQDHSTSARIDADLPRGMRLFFRVNDAPSLFSAPLAAYTPVSHINILTLTGGLLTQLSSRSNNEFTANFSVNHATQTTSAVPQSFAQATSGIVDTSNTFVAFYSPGPTLNVGPAVGNHLRQWNFVDTFSYSIKSHLLKFGADYRHVAPTFSLPPSFWMFAYSTQDYASGMLDSEEYNSYTPAAITLSNLSLFANDSWRVNSRFTADFGLRWEFDPPPTASGPGLLAMQGNPNDPSTISVAPERTPLYKTHYDNFAPRLGLAYTLRESARFGVVLRGGGGFFYDTGQAATASQASRFNYPYASSAQLFGVPLPSSSIDLSQFQLQSVGLPQIRLWLTDPNLVAPRTYSWSVSVDQKLGTQTMLSTSYIGNSAHDLLRENTFQFLSPSIARYQLIVYTNGENSSYNALQMQLRSNAGKRVNFLASYTYAHALDNGSSEFESVAGYYSNPKANSDNDIRHIFSTAIHYSPRGFEGNGFLKGLTGGWSIDSILLLQSAAPLSVYSFSTINTNPNLYNSYADIVPGVATIVSNPDAPGGKQLNPAAFVPAPGTRNGTSSRNGYRLFGLKQWDTSVSRSWPLWKESQLTFRIDAFNVVNHPNFAGVDTGLGDANFGLATASYAGAYGGSSNFTSGQLNRDLINGGPRSVQLSLRIKF